MEKINITEFSVAWESNKDSSRKISMMIVLSYLNCFNIIENIKKIFSVAITEISFLVIKFLFDSYSVTRNEIFFYVKYNNHFFF